ncbi:MAG: hypothetical protein CVT95_04795 [Bacteroidetes bacterium HGW-Bacteroidetes-12]|nr:MAG: hypothetical protein CVT95_04795 [Bacteroidetes bacterium HGW-Bacteroidetes-12]
MRNILYTILLFIFFKNVNGQNLPTEGVTKHGVTIVSVEYHYDRNFVWESWRKEGTLTDSVTTYYIKEKTIRSTGRYFNYSPEGLWKYYLPNKELKKEYNYLSNIKNVYQNSDNMYDTILSSVELQVRILLQKVLFSNEFKEDYIANLGQSYFSNTYDCCFPWFDYKIQTPIPTGFVITYDKKMEDGARINCFKVIVREGANLEEISLSDLFFVPTEGIDSLTVGELNSLNRINFPLSHDSIVELVMKNGFTSNDMPISYKIVWSKEGSDIEHKPYLLINGKAFTEKLTKKGGIATQSYNYILFDMNENKFLKIEQSTKKYDN